MIGYSDGCESMQSQIVLFMESCPERMVANKTMLITRTAFMMENQRDIDPYSYHLTLEGSNNAAIIRR